FLQWKAQAERNYAQLLNLLDEVQRYKLPSAGGNQDALIDYDRRRMVKEAMLERIVATTVETADAARYLLATSPAKGKRKTQHAPGQADDGGELGVPILQAVL